MKKVGILNSDIAKVLADLGHTDTICISDIGLPVPNGVKKIDLALDYGIPSFIQVLEVIDRYMKYEEVILADEIKENNAVVTKKVDEITKSVDKVYVSHEKFKELTKNCKVIIRTGENTPYANIILKSGVFFGLDG